MIVVDTSVVVAALLGHDSARAAIVDQRLIAPQVIDAEVIQALRGLALGGRITDDQGESLIRAWMRLEVDRLPMAPLIPRVWELRSAVTAYNALFVAAAEAHGVALVTADWRLASAPGPRCPIQIIAAAPS